VKLSTELYQLEYFAENPAIPAIAGTGSGVATHVRG
jgi:hypothetical protein